MPNVRVYSVTCWEFQGFLFLYNMLRRHVWKLGDGLSIRFNRYERELHFRSVTEAHLSHELMINLVSREWSMSM